MTTHYTVHALCKLQNLYLIEGALGSIACPMVRSHVSTNKWNHAGPAYDEKRHYQSAAEEAWSDCAVPFGPLLGSAGSMETRDRAI